MKRTLSSLTSVEFIKKKAAGGTPGLFFMMGSKH